MWFRIHTALLHNPKAQSLSGNQFKAWINLLCLAKEGDGVIPGVLQIAFHLRLKVLQAQVLMDDLERLGFVSLEPDGTYIPNDWNEHQYKSDVSTDRVKRFRKRSIDVSGNGSETPPDTDTDTDTDTEQNIRTPVPAVAETTKPRKSASTIGTRLSVETLPDEWAQFALTDCAMDRQRAERVFAEFRDYWIGVAGAKGRKADWIATWRNRCRDVSSRDGPKAGTFNFHPPETHTERAIRIGHERIRETGRL